MYQFKIKKQENGGYRFELGGIKMLIDDYIINDDLHKLINPNRTIAYFNIGDNIYGVSNDPWNFDTAEAFYDAILKQYTFFTGSNEGMGVNITSYSPAKIDVKVHNSTPGNHRSA